MGHDQRHEEITSREPRIYDTILEEKLVDGKVIGEALLESAREEALRTGHSIWYCLVQLRYLTQEQLMMFFARESGVAYVRISDYAVQEEVLNVFEPAFCINNVLFPLFKVGGTLYIAASNPLDASVVDACGRASGMNVELLMASAASIRAAQDAYWNLDERMLEAHVFVADSHSRLRGVSFYRKAERIPARMAVSVIIAQDAFVLSGQCRFDAVTTDFSKDGSSVGLQTTVYLPPQLALRVEFKVQQETVGCRANVVNCRMEQGSHYLVGLELVFQSDADKAKIVDILK